MIVAFGVRAVAGRYVAMELLPRHAVDARAALAAMPPLIKGYLRLGARIGDGCVIDRDFGMVDVLVVLPSVVVVYFLVVPISGGSIAATFPSLLKDLLLLALGLVAYGAFFACLGASLKRPLLIGMGFAFGWEQAVLLFPGYLKKFTIAYYLQALVPHAMPSDGLASLVQSFFRDYPSALVSAACLCLISAGFAALTSAVVERREYVLEQ